MLEFISSVLFYSSVLCGISALVNKRDTIVFFIASLNAFTLMCYINGAYSPILLAILLSLVFLLAGLRIIWSLPTIYYIARSHFCKQIGAATVLIINSMTLFTQVLKCLK